MSLLIGCANCNGDGICPECLGDSAYNEEAGGCPCCFDTGNCPECHGDGEVEAEDE